MPNRKAPLTREDILREIHSVKDAISPIRGTMERLVVSISGDPLINDPEDIRHYRRSIMGRLDELALADIRVQEVMKTLAARMDAELTALRADAFNWTKVGEFVKQHWGKILLAGVVLLFEGPNAVQWVKARI